MFDRAGSLLRESRGRALLAEVPRAERAIVCLPPGRILYTETPLPAVSPAKRDALLRFAIEDKLTTDPATVHAVVLDHRSARKRNATLRHVVAAIDRSWLEGVMKALAQQGLAVSMVCDQAHALPVATRGWTVLLDGKHGSAVRADGYVYSFDLDCEAHLNTPPFGLMLALNEVRRQSAEQSIPTAIDVYQFAYDAEPSQKEALPAEAWSAALGLPVYDRGSLTRREWAKRALNISPACNLLTGEFAPQSVWSQRVRKARPVWWAAALILFIQMGFSAWEGWRLQRQARNIQADMVRIFRETFPQAQAVVDPRLQMQRNLDALRQERGLTAAFPARAQLAQAARILQDNATVSAVKFEQGALTVDANLASSDAQAMIQERAQQQNVTLAALTDAAVRLVIGPAK